MQKKADKLILRKIREKQTNGLKRVTPDDLAVEIVGLSRRLFITFGNKSARILILRKPLSAYSKH